MGTLIKECLKNKNKRNINFEDEPNLKMQLFDDIEMQVKENDKIDIYEKHEIIKIRSENKEIKTILRGLGNIGATCYMNATLQCLSNTEKLTNYFLQEFFYIKEDTTKKISNEYYKLLDNLWNSKETKNYYEPNDFKKVLSEEEPLFSGINANDSKDLLNFLLERLHKELNIKIEDKKDNNYEISLEVQLNEELTRQLFFKEFQNNYRSIISHLFYFTIETKAKCCGCNNTKYNFQINPFIEFPLEEINKYLYSQKRINTLVNNDGSNPDVNIYDCFDFYQKIDLMTGDNQMYCNICNNNFDSFYGTSIYVLSQYLIINLNRGKNASYQCKVNFPEELDLTQFVTYKELNTKFELYALICHIGPSSMSGHFVAYCKNRMDHKWYLYNDAIVTLCKTPYDYQKHMPYILFYQSKNNK